MFKRITVPTASAPIRICITNFHTTLAHACLQSAIWRRSLVWPRERQWVGERAGASGKILADSSWNSGNFMMCRLLLISALASALVSAVAAFLPTPPLHAACRAKIRLSAVGPHDDKWEWGRAWSRNMAVRRGATEIRCGAGAVTMVSSQKLITKPRTSHAW